MQPTNELNPTGGDPIDPNANKTADGKDIYAEESSYSLNDLLDFNKARIGLNRLVSDWKCERNDTIMRRAKRDVVVDVEALRFQKKLDPDETLIPVRVIDTNIQREQPAYVNYLKNSRRIVTFNSLENPFEDTQKLELEFTRGMTYISWETPHYKNVDGAQTHGWDAVEVVLDDSKPLGVALEHIGHDNLFFPRSSIDIQFSRSVVRRYEMTLLQLDGFTKVPYNFNQEQVEKLRASRKGSQKETETLEVYKHFCKVDSVVYVSWFCLSDGCNDWLKAPVKADLDLIDPRSGQPIPVTSYPIFVLPYRETEKPMIVEHKGRVYYDENKQEAQTAILSGYTNGLTRAATVFASPAGEDNTGSSLKEIEGVQLVGGRVFSKPLNFWHTDYPDPSVLKALQFFDVSNSQEVNQPSFAANNREDSRKTATEIQAASQQQQLLNSVQLTMFSTFIRQVYNFVWLIVQSKALQDKIVFLQIEQPKPVINPMTQQPIIGPDGQPMMQPNKVNNKQLISQTFDVRAAGDVDVIQRQEKIQQMQQDWPVIQNTPLRDRFLQDLIKLKYPDTGEQYATLLAQQPQLQGLQAIIARFATIMQGVLQQHPDIMTALPPEQQADVTKLVQQGLQVAQQVQQPQQPQQQ